MAKQRITFVTGNINKLKEAKGILKDFPYEVNFLRFDFILSLNDCFYCCTDC